MCGRCPACGEPPAQPTRAVGRQAEHAAHGAAALNRPPASPKALGCGQLGARPGAPRRTAAQGGQGDGHGHGDDGPRHDPRISVAPRRHMRRERPQRLTEELLRRRGHRVVTKATQRAEEAPVAGQLGLATQTAPEVASHRRARSLAPVDEEGELGGNLLARPDEPQPAEAPRRRRGAFSWPWHRHLPRQLDAGPLWPRPPSPASRPDPSGLE
jgi:hypothetical protein